MWTTGKERADTAAAQLNVAYELAAQPLADVDGLQDAATRKACLLSRHPSRSG